MSGFQSVVLIARAFKGKMEKSHLICFCGRDHVCVCRVAGGPGTSSSLLSNYFHFSLYFLFILFILNLMKVNSKKTITGIPTIFAEL